jgi:hypothetical protein
MTKRKYLKLVLWGALGLALFEAAARLYGFGNPPMVVRDTEIEYYHLPNMSYTRFGNRVSINRYGLRSRDFDKDTLTPENHVAVFGDSIVYGNHDISQEDTIAFVLETSLRKESSELVVSSIAASSWGPSNLVAYLKRFGPFHGRFAVLVVSTHDMADIPSFVSDVIPYRTTPSYFALHDFGQAVVELTSRRLWPFEDKRSFEELRSEGGAAFQRLVAMLQRDFGSVLLLHHPSSDELAAGDLSGFKHFEALARSTGIRIEPLATVYSQAEANGAQIYLDGMHLSPDGSRLVAQFIEQQMQAVR